ncbi:hypothetical protein PVAP13_8KG048200 [Panicum virgatum]|uniref:Uncharacterized protein n=1 Tax=Panicum virgatum TaxID=38727 RepID=A0A8T0PIW1_PANVG|nr:hypothetical protein PVAP13_8KG048200 [Panicum virgatum]
MRGGTRTRSLRAQHHRRRRRRPRRSATRRRRAASAGAPTAKGRRRPPSAGTRRRSLWRCRSRWPTSSTTARAAPGSNDVESSFMPRHLPPPRSFYAGPGFITSPESSMLPKPSFMIRVA